MGQTTNPLTIILRARLVGPGARLPFSGRGLSTAALLWGVLAALRAFAALDHHQTYIGLVST
jgi:hypothetical protein